MTVDCFVIFTFEFPRWGFRHTFSHRNWRPLLPLSLSHTHTAVLPGTSLFRVNDCVPKSKQKNNDKTTGTAQNMAACRQRTTTALPPPPLGPITPRGITCQSLPGLGATGYQLNGCTLLRPPSLTLHVATAQGFLLVCLFVQHRATETRHAMQCRSTATSLFSSACLLFAQ